MRTVNTIGIEYMKNVSKVTVYKLVSGKGENHALLY